MRKYRAKCYDCLTVTRMLTFPEVFKAARFHRVEFNHRQVRLLTEKEAPVATPNADRK